MSQKPRVWISGHGVGFDGFDLEVSQYSKETLSPAERPHVTIDRVFLCAKAPFRALRSGGTVSDIVRGALRAAGIENPPTRGANLIRHTTATTMLRAGATLDEIGTILRHKSPDTTAHYAKVDVATLQQIAQHFAKRRRAHPRAA